MLRPLPLFNILTVAALIVMACTFKTSAANERQFHDMASEILAGLDAAKADQFPATSGYGAPAIAIRPFTQRETEVDVDTANDFNRNLLAALQQQAGGRFEFVSRETIGRLIEDVRLSGISEEESTKRITDLKINSRADILISGDLRLEDGETVLSYQALSAETARVFVSTPPRVIGASSNAVAAAGTPSLNGFSRIVAEAESLLDDLGYNPGPVDGHMTKETRSALSAYQLDSALPVNGRMTRKVVDNMRRDTR
jgi:hypothetical protein